MGKNQKVVGLVYYLCWLGLLDCLRLLGLLDCLRLLGLFLLGLVRGGWVVRVVGQSGWSRWFGWRAW